MSSPAMKANKTYRQGAILKILRRHPVTTQEELAEQLEAEGIKTTQVTLSRDIRELRLVKTLEGYREPSGLAASPALGPPIGVIAAEFLVEARVAQNLVVIKTLPGGANPLTSALDHESWEEVVGTIAGDDTVLVVAPDHRAAREVSHRLLEVARR